MNKKKNTMTPKSASTPVFDIEGPFPIPFDDSTKALFTATHNGREIFGRTEAKNLSGKTGCYIFAKSCRNALKPFYVGMTNASFGQEVFSHANQLKLQDIRQKFKNGRIFFFLLVGSTRNKGVITWLETKLIASAIKVNPDAVNIQNPDSDKCVLNGIDNAGKGKPTRTIAAFKKMMGM